MFKDLFINFAKLTNKLKMKVEVKNSNFKPAAIKPLFDYLTSTNAYCLWDYSGLSVEIDPTFDFENDNVLIRWTDIQEGFNDKLIIKSLEQFKSMFFPLTNA